MTALTILDKFPSGMLETDPHGTTISHTVQSNDLAYDGFAAPEVAVTILEDECGAWGFDPMDFDKNCNVGVPDFGQFTGNWLNCSRPHMAECTRY